MYTKCESLGATPSSTWSPYACCCQQTLVRSCPAFVMLRRRAAGADPSPTGAQLRQHEVVRVLMELVDDDDVPTVPIERSPFAETARRKLFVLGHRQRRHVAARSGGRASGEASTILRASS